jgi:hypothetical protein
MVSCSAAVGNNLGTAIAVPPSRHVGACECQLTDVVLLHGAENELD